MTRTRLFHNNTVRTIAPEYEWVPSADGTRLLIVAERDGDTVSPERGVYLVDLAKKVTRDEVRARVKANLDAERRCAPRAQKMFPPIAAAVQQVVGEASVARVYGYEKTLFDFDSKHISQPGNKQAADVPLRHVQVVRLRAGVPVVRVRARNGARRDRPPTSSRRSRAP